MCAAPTCASHRWLPGRARRGDSVRTGSERAGATQAGRRRSRRWCRSAAWQRADARDWRGSDGRRSWWEIRSSCERLDGPNPVGHWPSGRRGAIGGEAGCGSAAVDSRGFLKSRAAACHRAQRHAAAARRATAGVDGAGLPLHLPPPTSRLPLPTSHFPLPTSHLPPPTSHLTPHTLHLHTLHLHTLHPAVRWCAPGLSGQRHFSPSCRPWRPTHASSRCTSPQRAALQIAADDTISEAHVQTSRLEMRTSCARWPRCSTSGRRAHRLAAA